MAFDASKFQPEGDSGGRESKPYSATVIDAYFEEKDYGPQLVLQNRLDEADQMEYHWMASGEDRRWFGTGKIQVERGKPFQAWSIVGGGAAIKGDTDDRMFRNDSDLGRLWNQIASLPNVSELPDDFDPRVAASWKGLHFRWAAVPVRKQRVKKDANGNDVLNDKGKMTYEGFDTSMDLPIEMGSGTSVTAGPDVVLDDLGLTPEQVTALSKLAQPGVSDSDFVGQAVVVVAGNQAATKALTSNPAGFRSALPF